MLPWFIHEGATEIVHHCFGQKSLGLIQYEDAFLTVEGKHFGF